MQNKSSDIQEVTPQMYETFKERGYTNTDILPKSTDQRTRTSSNFFTLWQGSIHNIPNYAAVVGYLMLGMSPMHTMIALVLGGIAVALLLSVNGKAGTKYGIPFSMHLRSVFGEAGAKLPGFLRGCVAAIAWYGVQNYNGAVALTILIGKIWPGYLEIGGGETILGGITVPQLISFIVFWLLNMLVGLGGGEVLNKFTAVLSPLIYIVFGAMTIWAIKVGGGFTTIMTTSLPGAENTNLIFAYLIIIASTLSVWAAPIVSISDHTQTAVSESDQRKGQLGGLSFGYLVFALMSIVIIIGGSNHFEFVPSADNGVLDFINKWDSVPAIVVSTGVFLMTTISTNATGNIIPAGYQLAALMPKSIDYKKGVWIAGIISVLIQPWRLLAGDSGILAFLDLIGSLLGPIAGVMVIHYLLIQKEEINLDELYYAAGEKSQYAGINKNAYIAVIVGLVISLLGNFIPALSFLSRIAYIAGFIIAAVVYYFLARNKAN